VSPQSKNYRRASLAQAASFVAMMGCSVVSTMSRRLQQIGQEFWNHRFVLITPEDYAGLDVTLGGGKGPVIRPNVLCLFRLHDSSNLDDRDVLGSFVDSSNRKIHNTLPHEIGHMIGQHGRREWRYTQGNKICVGRPG
jgi:hypothetical protein